MADDTNTNFWQNINPANWSIFNSPPVAGSSGAPQMSGFASPMTPGQTGTGGFTAPTSDDPWTSASQTGNTGSKGTDWNKVASALKDLSKAGSTDSSGSGIGKSAGVIGQSSSQTGQPRAAVSMDNLMKMLIERQQGYATAAMSPQSSAPQTQRNTSYGLLGY